MVERPSNGFLLALSEESYNQFKGHLVPVDLVLGEYLQRDERQTDWVYFPENGLLSLISAHAAGESVETSMAGNEGAAGLIEACGSQVSNIDCLVQVDGRAHRARAIVCRALAMSDPSFSATAWKLADLQIAESRQSALCQAMHPVQHRFARWMLESTERSGGRNPLPMTQEFLAAMLGVQRTTVSSFAAELQRKGLIAYRRGKIELIDTVGLEAMACECRQVTKRHRQRLGFVSIIL